MPIFENVEIPNSDMVFDLEFDVVCNECGKDISLNASTTNKKYPQVQVDLCPYCKEKLENIISELEKK